MQVGAIFLSLFPSYCVVIAFIRKKNFFFVTDDENFFWKIRNTSQKREREEGF